MDQMTLYIFVLATGLVAVLFVHELGHLLVARYYGIKVLDLSVGFGPPMVNFTDRFGTSWRLRAFPIGGSCSLFMPEECNATPSGIKFRQLLRQRAAIYAAGPTFNLFCAIQIHTFGLIMCQACGLFSGEIGSLGATGVRLIGEFSLANALFNLLPFPPLDGGRLCLIAIEACLGRPISPAYEKRFVLLSNVSFTGITMTFLVWAFVGLR
jgi:membrane-associated protease RseP (regulator of RpoE activity)